MNKDYIYKSLFYEFVASFSLFIFGRKPFKISCPYAVSILFLNE